MKLKFAVFITFFFAGLVPAFTDAGAAQRRDIDAVVKELDYLIEVTRQLHHKYRRDNSKIRFNYAALLAQLRTARDGVREYLNDDLLELHSAPPMPVKSQLTTTR